MSRQAYPDCGHARDKGRAHAEAALNGVDPACGICASFTLARANKRLAFWERTDAGKAAPAPSGGIPPVGLRAPSASGSTVLGSRSTAEAAPASLSPSPSPASLVAADHEAVELPPGCEDQPVPELDFGLDNESLLDFSDEHASDEEEMQLELDVKPRATSPPATSRTLGQQLHEVALWKAGCLGLPLPPPPSVQASLLDGEFYAGPAVAAPSPIPFFAEVHGELTTTWATPYSGRAPVTDFAAYLHLDQAKESGYLSFSPVEDTVAGYLSPASPTMRLGQRPLLPTRVARHQAALAEKAYLAAGQAACSTNERVQ